MIKKAVPIVAMFMTVLLVAAGGAQASSYYYESISRTLQEGKKKPQEDLMRGWVDGEKVKLEFADKSGDGRAKKGMYMLTTDGGQTVFMVDPENKSYFEFDPAQLMGMAGGMMEIEFRDVQMEKLGESAGGSMHGRDTTQYTWRSQFTMAMNVMGMKRESRYDTTQEMWVTRDLGNEAWNFWLKMAASSMKGEEFVEWAEESGMANTFPLKTKAVTTVTNKKGKTSRMTSETEVTELRVGPVPAAAFEIPADYTKQEMVPPEWGGEAGGEAGGPMKQLKGIFGKKKDKKKDNDG